VEAAMGIVAGKEKRSKSSEKKIKMSLTTNESSTDSDSSEDGMVYEGNRTESDQESSAPGVKITKSKPKRKDTAKIDELLKETNREIRKLHWCSKHGVCSKNKFDSDCRYTWTLSEVNEWAKDVVSI
jgi:hypothetical protein